MESESVRVLRIAGAIAAHGYAIERAFVAPDAIAALREHALSLDAFGELRAAAIGRGAGRLVDSATRGDRIRWLDNASALPEERFVRGALEALRLALNRNLTPGLFGFDAHYSIYPPGARYARHRDRFRDDDARVLSFWSI